ncbi:DUF1254 domain-containing protein [Rhodococcus aerolatus]
MVTHPGATQPADDLLASARRAHEWGYALVQAAQLRQNLTVPQDPFVTRSPSSPGAPLNRIGHQRALSDPSYRAGVAPNVDTLYSVAWLDLADGPLVLTVPPVVDRYYTVQLAAADTSTLASVGRRTHGGQLPPVVITGPGHDVDLPAGHLVVRSTTRYFMVACRILVDGSPADLHEVHRLQDRVTLQTWAQHLAGSAELPEVPRQRPLDEGVSAELGELGWLQQLGNVLRDETLPAADLAVAASLAPIGLGPGGVDLGTLGADAREQVAAGLRAGRSSVLHRSTRLGRQDDGWTTNVLGPRFGADHLLRSAVAKDQIYVTLPEEALYPTALVDRSGEPLHGGARYELTFPAGELPPSDAFWSLTVYRSDGGGLCENPISRYSIGDRTDGLVLGRDGALTVHVRSDRPAEEHVANWLPVPAEGFRLILRVYVPQERALSGAWAPPPVERVDGP